MTDATPKLIEHNVKNYLHNMLQTSHETRTTMYYYALNLGILFFFIAVFGSALYYCYHSKKTPYELEEKMMKDQEYVMSKIRFYQSHQKQVIESKVNPGITNLPMMNPGINATMNMH